MCDHLEAISSEEGTRKAIADDAKAHALVKMEFGAFAPGAGAGGGGPGPLVPEDADASLDAFGNAKCYNAKA